MSRTTSRFVGRGMNKETPSLFNVPLEGGDALEVIAQIEQAQTRPFWIVTANPEILLAAQEDVAYGDAVRSASWRTVDGFGLQLVLKLRGLNSKRLTGVDLGEALLRYAAEKNWRVVFFGGFNASAEKAADVWRKQFPNLDLQVLPGGAVQEDGTEDGKSSEHREVLLSLKPNLILVALGGGKKQELWIAQHREEFFDTNVVVGIGGAFDMWSGNLRRAPSVIRALGLEWLWRLTLEPKRWRRIWRAVVLFLFRALKA